MSLDDLNSATEPGVFPEQIHDNNHVLNELKALQLDHETPFGANKSAIQNVQLSIDPSEGLTRKRYAYLSNETLFDTTLISEVEAGIRLATRGTESADEARLRSAVAGQYVSQALGQPGMAIVVDDENITITDGLVSLSHGELYWGAFLWDSANGNVETGFGYKLDSSGLEFFIRSLGSHIGDSPIPQSEFSRDSFDGTGPSGYTLNPADGLTYNWPFTWYNEGTITAGLVNPETNRLELGTKETISGRPSTDTPNLPVQCVARNAGTAKSLGVEIGGIQFSTSGGSRNDIERRRTDETRITSGNYISNTRTLTENAVDPSAEPGKPLVSFQRDDAESRTINFRGNRLKARVEGGSIYIIAWDEYEPAAALTGEDFTSTVSLNNAGQESHILTDTQATAYTPQTAVVRGVNFFEGGGGSNTETATEEIDLRIPLGATRIYTAVNNGSSADVNPIIASVQEAY